MYTFFRLQNLCTIVPSPSLPHKQFFSADQMPLHRNESSGQKTMNFAGRSQSTFVKENYHLSRERATVMTSVSSSKKINPPRLEFIFKGWLDHYNLPWSINRRDLSNHRCVSVYKLESITEFWHCSVFSKI